MKTRLNVTENQVRLYMGIDVWPNRGLSRAAIGGLLGDRLVLERGTREFDAYSLYSSRVELLERLSRCDLELDQLRWHDLGTTNE